jgi:hypothetical protein
MLLHELQKQLDAIGWKEQMEFELSEQPGSSPADIEWIESQIRALGESIDVTLLDALEKEDGYLVWALRLSPAVKNAAPEFRARKYVDDPNWRVRYWARKLLTHSHDV